MTTVATRAPEYTGDMSACVRPEPKVSTLYSGIIIPPGALRVRRYSWQRPRWWEWLQFRKLRCPANHHFPNGYELDEDGSGRLRCNEPIVGARGGCGLWVWMTRLPGEGHLVIEVTERDLNHMSTLRTASKKIDYLAIFEQLERVR